MVEWLVLMEGIQRMSPPLVQELTKRLEFLILLSLVWTLKGWMDGWVDGWKWMERWKWMGGWKQMERNSGLHHEEGKHQQRFCYSADVQYLQKNQSLNWLYIQHIYNFVTDKTIGISYHIVHPWDHNLLFVENPKQSWISVPHLETYQHSLQNKIKTYTMVKINLGYQSIAIVTKPPPILVSYSEGSSEVVWDVKLLRNVWSQRILQFQTPFH